jgi:hypothetical protein
MKSSILRQVSNPIKMGIYETSTTLPDGGRLGMALQLDDGREFRLALAGGVALSPGKMCQAVAPVTNHTNLAVYAAAAVGANSVTVTLGGTAVAANDYLWGTLHINDGPGVGQSFKIAGHLIGATTTANVVINIYDSIDVALTTSSYATLTYNSFWKTIIAPNGGLTAAACGVPLVPVAIGSYYWSQIKGPAACLTTGTIVIGEPVGLGGTTDGAFGPFGTGAAETTASWGTVMHVNASTKYSLVNLALQI